jgi:phosphoribosylformylglycinamidine cyclo-ligase
MLASVIREDEIDLAGCAVGLIPEGREPLFGQALQPGDDIVLVASSGLHTNGASLGRTAAESVGGLGVAIKGGGTVGDALLAPSAIYARLLDAIYKTDIGLSYAVPVTGHGLRKLMRANRELTYRIRHLLSVPPVFEFIVETLGLSALEAYGTLNMGVGFALFVRGGQGADIVALAEEQDYSACVGGNVEAGTRRVVLDPVGVIFEADELQLR